jgi:hypothetical protein
VSKATGGYALVLLFIGLIFLSRVIIEVSSPEHVFEWFVDDIDPRQEFADAPLTLPGYGGASGRFH